MIRIRLRMPVLVPTIRMAGDRRATAPAQLGAGRLRAEGVRLGLTRRQRARQGCPARLRCSRPTHADGGEMLYPLRGDVAAETNTAPAPAHPGAGAVVVPSGGPFHPQLGEHCALEPGEFVAAAAEVAVPDSQPVLVLLTLHHNFFWTVSGNAAGRLQVPASRGSSGPFAGGAELGL